MKNELSNIALEGTCSGDVVGGLLSWTGEAFRRFCFKGEVNVEKAKEENETLLEDPGFWDLAYRFTSILRDWRGKQDNKDLSPAQFGERWFLD